MQTSVKEERIWGRQDRGEEIDARGRVQELMKEIPAYCLSEKLKKVQKRVHQKNKNEREKG